MDRRVVVAGRARSAWCRRRRVSMHSTGKSWSIHPTKPTSAIATPTALTAGWVTTPAKPRVTPTAVTNGHAVGAGDSTVSGTRSPSTSGVTASAAHHVDRGQHHNPHGVDEVPVPGQELDAFGMLGAHRTQDGKDPHQDEKEQAEGDMARVKTHQRVEGRPEEVGTDGEPLAGDEPVPLQGSAGEKFRSQDDGEEKPDPEDDSPPRT